MQLGPIERPVPTLIAWSVALLVGGTLLVAGLTSGAAFGLHNPGWQGVSDLQATATQDGLSTQTAVDPADYATVTPSDTVAVLVAPGNYTPAQRTALRTFLEEGGTVVIASRDPETVNPLLQTLETQIRVAGPPLRDEVKNAQSPDFPLATDVANQTYVREAEGLALNHGTALIAAGNATALANSSPYAYLDRNRNAALDGAEQLASRPVVARQPIGAGDVVVVSDPSVFINAMLDRDANRALAMGLLAPHETLVIDRSTASLPPLIQMALLIQDAPVLSVGFGGGLVGLVVLWELGVVRRVRQRVGDRTPAPPTLTDDPAALQAYLEAEHPEWDPTRRERVLAGLMNDPDKPSEEHDGEG